MIALCSKSYIAWREEEPLEREGPVAADTLGSPRGPDDPVDDEENAAEEAARARLRRRKVACKGVQRGNNARQLTPHNFRRCLLDGVPLVGTNRGFEYRSDAVYTYQARRRVHGIYLKRRVEPNLRDTRSLPDLAVDR